MTNDEVLARLIAQAEARVGDMAELRAVVEAASEAARAVNVLPPSDPSEQEKAAIEELSRLEGEAFDRAIVEHMVKVHDEGVESHAEAARKESGAVRDYAEATLPRLRAHLEEVRALARSE